MVPAEDDVEAQKEWASTSAARRKDWVEGVCASNGSGERRARGAACCGAARALPSRLRRSWKSFVPVVRQHPWILLTSLAVAALLAAVSAVGVVLAAEAEAQNRADAAQTEAAEAEAQNRVDAAQSLAQLTAAGIEARLLQVMVPVLALSVLVRDDPYYPRVAAKFYATAAELGQMAHAGAPAAGDGDYDLRLAPQGVLRLVAPHNSSTQGVVGLDLLADPVRRPAALTTIEHRQLAVQGPVMLSPEGFLGIVMRMPIFVGNATNPREAFGAPSAATNCSIPICYDPATKTRFWGFAVAVANFDMFTSGGGGGGGGGRATLLGGLRDQGYDYALYVPQPEGGPPLRIPAAGPPLASPVAAAVTVPGGSERDPTPGGRWRLELAPRGGWAPRWRAPLLALVLVVSAALGALLLGRLVNRQQQAWLLKELKESNAALADEKRRTELHLINLLLDQGRLEPARGAPRFPSSNGGGAPRPRWPGGARRDILPDTLDTAREKIEEMRRHVGAAAPPPPDEQLQLQELLGEGAFGKVYKGLWRGTIVAVKTMILPAKMSGAEKRERMAIMEAAISSAMNHPNIVQMYTYTIKSMGHSAGESFSSSGIGHGLASDATPPESDDGCFFQASPAVHNFEVSLVMEWCELGTLRDALDGGAFKTNAGGVNYAAVLDTAADVARALLHLHRQQVLHSDLKQVLHSDLKARNVLLKADGKSGRGCIAKVADFGLAVQIDPSITHVSEYQGTPSHMPPEALLHGRVSKAGDVYSFGVTLYEMYTGDHAYRGVPVALLGHQVSVQGVRPRFPPSAPAELQELAAECWAANPEDRPSFEAILDRVLLMRRRAGGRTERLRTYKRLSATTGFALTPHVAPEDHADGPGGGSARLLAGETIGEAAPLRPRRPQAEAPPPAAALHHQGFVVVDFGLGQEHQEMAPAAADGGGAADSIGGGMVISFAASFFARRRGQQQQQQQQQQLQQQQEEEQ
ncbi:MAG: hypothetical protein J3K34DRAFT_515195 [Monoraphidium minutum]|nr:MAG: hypothetical protein J3K34DRAFT_515195 [Monoraphidium minutum]